MITENPDFNDLENRILEIANKTFLRYGIENTTMSQIAKDAGISRTSLNYYFRSKKHLEQKLIDSLRNKIIPALNVLLNDETLSIKEKIDSFVDEYINLISKYPLIPSFIFSELNQDPKWILNVFRRQNLNLKKFMAQVSIEANEGKIKAFHLENLFVNVFGLCVFSILSKPLLMEFFFEHNETKMIVFMESRKSEIKQIMHDWLKPE